MHPSVETGEASGFQHGRIEHLDEQGRNLVLGQRTYAMPYDVRVLDWNGALRSTDYLRAGMIVQFKSRAQDGKHVLTEVRVVDTAALPPN
jgi:hypothetical protein